MALPHRNLSRLLDYPAGDGRTRLHEALEQLPEQYREVIRLSYFEGLSHAKIAAELDTPLGTIKSRIREAVIKLRRLLGVKE